VVGEKLCQLCQNVENVPMSIGQGIKTRQWWSTKPWLVTHSVQTTKNIFFDYFVKNPERFVRITYKFGGITHDSADTEKPEKNADQREKKYIKNYKINFTSFSEMDMKWCFKEASILFELHKAFRVIKFQYAVVK